MEKYKKSMNMMYSEIEQEKQMAPQKPNMSKIIVFVILVQFIIETFFNKKSIIIGLFIGIKYIVS